MKRMHRGVELAPAIVSIVDRQSGASVDIAVTDADRTGSFDDFVKSRLRPAFLALWSVYDTIDVRLQTDDPLPHTRPIA